MTAEFHIDAEFLRVLVDEEIIHLKESSEGDMVMSSDDVERVRIVRFLTDELEVNMPGAEVIIHMRDEMLAMQRQFSEILDALVEELRRKLPR